jgi:hypothetical protein
VNESFRKIESLMYGGFYLIRKLNLKFNRNFACVDGDMAKAKLPLPYDMAQKRNGGAGRRLIYD